MEDVVALFDGMVKNKVKMRRARQSARGAHFHRVTVARSQVNMPE